MRRRLVSIRRRVPEEGRRDYDRAWSRARELAVQHGAHAWRFAALDDRSVSLEFLEFAAGDDPRAAEPLGRLLQDLAARFDTREEEWVEDQGE